MKEASHKRYNRYPIGFSNGLEKSNFPSKEIFFSITLTNL